jgi:hypothetical protein
MRLYLGAVVGLLFVSALLAGCGSEKPTQEESIAAIDALGGRFRFDGSWLELRGPEITDAALGHLEGLTGLKQLHIISRTKITDAGLVHLEGLTGLEKLTLHSTEITDAGLAHLEGLWELESLSLAGTKVTDAGLVHLEGLTFLKWLDLNYTKVTAAGVARLSPYLPACDIHR